MPKSSIIHKVEQNQSGTDAENQDGGNVEYKVIAHKLHAKYIKDTCNNFMVNISSHLRRRYQYLDEMDWNVDMIEIFTVFDPLIEEMFKYMAHSFVRFQAQ